MIKRISIEGIYKILKKSYRWILAILFMLLLGLSILIFYQYVYLVIESKPTLIDQEISVDQETLEKVLSNINERDKNLSRVLKIKYPDLFSP